jgi:tetratricopeptide (TPR) repeat protein
MLILSSKYTEALELSTKLLNEDSENPELYYHQALINKLLFRYTDAEKAIKMAIQKDTSNIYYLAEYGFILLKLDKDNEAEKIFAEVIKRNPYHVNSGITLSNMYLKKKKDEKTEMAEKILLGLYSKDTLNGFLARNIGLCGYKLGNSKKSIKWFSKAIQLDSTDIKAYRFLFSTYAVKEEFEKAFEVIEKAKRFDPENTELFVIAGDLHVTCNHHYCAVKEYKMAFEIDRYDFQIAGKLGLSYEAIKKYEKAKHYLLIADSNPYILDIQVSECLGSIYKKMNKPDSSNIFFTKALDILRPDYNSIFEIYINVAENYYALNNYIHAIGWYKRSLNLEINGVWYNDNRNKILVDLASIYADKLNDKEKAIKYLMEITKDIYINDDKYYEYAQQQITKLNEELFMEGKLNM